MPLLPGKAEIGHNIKEMQKAGHPRDQSIAAALRTAGVPKKNAEKWQVIKNVEAFSIGEKRGKKYTPEDLKDIAENFQKFNKGQRPGFDVPAVLGHEETPEKQLKFLENTGIPAAGWIRDAKTDGKKLFVDLEASPELHRAIKDGSYGPVSIEIYDKPPEGLPGARGKMMRRLAMLGGEIPQDKNLARMSAYSERLRSLRTTRLTDCVAHEGYVTCFSEVHMPTHEEMVAKLAEHGFDPEALKTHEGCMAEMMRMAEAMKPGQGGLGDMDWDADPQEPKDDEERKQYGEMAHKMTAWAEKLKKYAENTMGGSTTGDPLVKTEVRPGPSGSEKSGLGGPKETAPKSVSMSEQVERLVDERVALLRAEFRPIIERANEQDQLDVLNFCEQQVREGKLTPAQVDRKSPFSVLNELLELDNAKVVTKFSENGRDVPLTRRRQRMEQIKRGPKVWKNSEVSAGSAGGAQAGDKAPDQGEARIDKFCEDHLLGDDIKKSLMEGWESLKKARGSRADVGELLDV